MLQADVCQALSCEAAALLGGHPPEVQAALQSQDVGSLLPESSRSKQLIDDIGYKVDPSYVNGVMDLFAKFDDDTSGSLEFEEFKALYEFLQSQGVIGAAGERKKPDGHVAREVERLQKKMSSLNEDYVAELQDHRNDIEEHRDEMATLRDEHGANATQTDAAVARERAKEAESAQSANREKSDSSMSLSRRAWYAVESSSPMR